MGHVNLLYIVPIFMYVLLSLIFSGKILSKQQVIFIDEDAKTEGEAIIEDDQKILEIFNRLLFKTSFYLNAEAH